MQGWREEGSERDKRRHRVGGGWVGEWIREMSGWRDGCICVCVVREGIGVEEDG